jgi:hypothetical protein
LFSLAPLPPTPHFSTAFYNILIFSAFIDVMFYDIVDALFSLFLLGTPFDNAWQSPIHLLTIDETSLLS